MAKNLVIVESPAKAKTIEKYLGKDYIVKSSFGHIRDLVKKNFGVEIENNFNPVYEIMPDKKKIVADLRKEVKKAELVILASDEDREGEAIAWHLSEVLKLTKKNTRRIVFNEITKNAIVEAVKNPREINLDIVNAQQARRILDRLVGFELSSVLWKKVKASLSAGRVQSVAVRLIVEREREIINFKSNSFYKVFGIFSVSDEKGNSTNFKTELSSNFKTKEEVVDFFNKFGSIDYKVGSVDKKPGKRSPSAPFTTSSLQQEAGRKLGFPVSKTMRVAQSLYEAGMITYMRTDSVNLSKFAIGEAEKAVKKDFGDKYHKKRTFKTKVKGAQEAHEAVRPTYFEKLAVEGSYDERRLYDLIRKRALASQMSDAIFEKTNVKILIPGSELFYSATGEVPVFDGFLKAYGLNTDEEVVNKEQLPALKVGGDLGLINLEGIQRFTKHAARYTESGLVKKLEEQGIGRPSTYAPTISTIQNRGYVLKEDREGERRKYTTILFDGKISEIAKEENVGTEKSKLFPTDIGMVVTDFLIENFGEIIDYNFTANVEDQFDTISLGKLKWQTMLDDFYSKFHKQVEKTIEFSERNTGERILGTDPETGKEVSVRIGRYGPVAQLGIADEENKPKFASLNKEQHLETITLEQALELLNNSATGKLLGVDPVSGKNIYARLARYGAVVQLGEADDKKDKPKFASLLKGMSLDTIDLGQAVELLKLPRDVGMFEDKKVVAAVGRFGPYVRHDSKFISLKKDDNPLNVTIERAVELIIEKREKDKKRLIKEFPENADIKIIKDRWNRPCIFYNKKYFNIADIKNPEKMTLEECLKIAEKLGGKLPKKTAKKATKKTTKKTAKKTTAKKTIKPKKK